MRFTDAAINARSSSEYARGLARGVEMFGALDNLADNQDPNLDRLLPAGTPAPIYRPDIGRTIRFGVRWTFDKK